MLNSSNLLYFPVSSVMSLVSEVAGSLGNVINEQRSPRKGNQSNNSQNNPFGETVLSDSDSEEQGWKNEKNKAKKTKNNQQVKNRMQLWLNVCFP